MDPIFVAQLGCHLARALQAIHNARDARGTHLGLVHRDVTPANVIVLGNNDVRILDFGVVKRNGDNLTVTGQVKGKLGYMAPEQVEGGEVSSLGDIFALGALLWEVATLRPLFVRANPLDTVGAVLQAEPLPPSLLCGRIPPELDAILLRALARHPDDRYQSAEELADALEGFLFDMGVHHTFSFTNPDIVRVAGPVVAARRMLGVQIAKGLPLRPADLMSCRFGGLADVDVPAQPRACPSVGQEDPTMRLASLPEPANWDDGSTGSLTIRLGAL
jgi:serine/threonine protein kinase